MISESPVPSFGVKSLGEILEEHIKTLESDSKLTCYVLAEEYPGKEFSGIADPTQTASHYLASRHMILVFQEQSKPAAEMPPKKPRQAIVAGMTTFEYISRTTRAFSYAYIQYLDTTGMFKPRKSQGQLTKNLIRGYFKYCTESLTVETIHLLASAKPSLMFAGSEYLKDKAPLNSGNLIRYWISITGDCSWPHDTSCYVFCPNPDHPTAIKIRTELDLIQVRDGSSQIRFNYGFHYPEGESVAKHVPLFEDDPKWRHFEAITDTQRHSKRARLEKDTVTVGEFFESLQIRPEFREEIAAFLVIRLDRHIHNQKRKDEQELSNSKATPVTLANRMLGTLTFDTDEKAVHSSMKIWAWLRLMGCRSFIIPTCLSQNTIPQSLFEPKPISDVCDLQGLIRRRSSNIPAIEASR